MEGGQRTGAITLAAVTDDDAEADEVGNLGGRAPAPPGPPPQPLPGNADQAQPASAAAAPPPPVPELSRDRGPEPEPSPVPDIGPGLTPGNFVVDEYEYELDDDGNNDEDQMVEDAVMEATANPLSGDAASAATAAVGGDTAPRSRPLHSSAATELSARQQAEVALSAVDQAALTRIRRVLRTMAQEHEVNQAAAAAALAGEQAPQVVHVTVPPDAFPGCRLQVQLPNGTTLAITVPEGIEPGSTIQAVVPPH